jgi:hypothetical protein
LRKQAASQPQGVQRRAALVAVRPLTAFAQTLRLTTPRHTLQAAIGREHQDEVDSVVHLTPPPARPAAAPVREQRPTSKPKPRTPVAPSRPLRVWVGGDSLAQVPGEALQRLPDVHVVGVESRLSTGLGRPDLYNWYTRFREVISHIRPTAVVLSFGADDAHSFMTGVPDDRAIGSFGSPSWIAEYRRRVDGVVREFEAAGIATVWLGLPIPGGPGFRRSFPVMNRILASIVAAHPTSRYVDTWHLLANGRGKYTPYLRVGGKVTLMRLSDGVHYTAAAGDLVAERVVTALREAARVRRASPSALPSTAPSSSCEPDAAGRTGCS